MAPRKRAKEPAGIRKVRKAIKDNPGITIRELAEMFNQTETWVKYRVGIIEERNPELFKPRPGKSSGKEGKGPSLKRTWEIVSSFCRADKTDTAHFVVFEGEIARDVQCLSCGRHLRLSEMRVECGDEFPEKDEGQKDEELGKKEKPSVSSKNKKGRENKKKSESSSSKPSIFDFEEETPPSSEPTILGE